MVFIKVLLIVRRYRMARVVIFQLVVILLVLFGIEISIADWIVSIFSVIGMMTIYLLFKNQFLTNNSASKVILFLSCILLSLQLIMDTLRFKEASEIMLISIYIVLLGLIILALMFFKQGVDKVILKKQLLFGYIIFNLMLLLILHERLIQ